ncbi:MAG: ImmA/IrrE family metallo-endopeptidase [Verrucomicrobia bacterium]|nr:ImmA/IrrE family metallo-endopeptidase [Verrucomicrobiota bacterium]
MSCVLEGREALRGALELRRRLGIPRERPLNVLDAADRLGLRVQLADIATCEGMFSADSKVILLNHRRPAGRRAFTCGHELGHWHFGHGASCDMLEFDRPDQEKPEERLVNGFAGFFLMPKRAVEEALARRGWRPESLTPDQTYIVAGQMGVGYLTLILHLCWSLQMISRLQADELALRSPRSLREQLAGPDVGPNLIVADEAWDELPIDLEVGDYTLLPKDAEPSGSQLQPIRGHRGMILFRAARPGISNVRTSTWTRFVRVSRREFTGWAKYRHFQDPDDET